MIFDPEPAWDAPSNMMKGDKRLTWREAYEEWQVERSRLSKFAALISDLDRSPHGRHEGDAEFQDPSGVSQGNPHVRTGQVIGYTISGHEIVMPPREHRGDPDAWIGSER